MNKCFLFLLFFTLTPQNSITNILSNSVCVFCVSICVHKTVAGRSRLSCLCRDSVTANCAPLCTPWPWQAAWHFREACPDTALPKSSGAGTVNWLRNCLKIKGNWHLCKLFICRGAPGINLSSFLSFLSLLHSHQHHQGSGQQQQGSHRAWDRGMFAVSLLLLILLQLKFYSDQGWFIYRIKLTVSTWQL